MSSARSNSAVVVSEEATAAHVLEQKVKQHVAEMRRLWVDLGGALYAFQQAEAWRTLGYESFEQWLAGPEIELSRRHVFQLIEAYRELAVKRGVSEDVLARTEITKVAEILPAVRRGQVEPEQALSDVEMLSRRDLHERYSGEAMPPNQSNDEARRGPRLDAESEPAMQRCTAEHPCGRWYKP